MAATLSMHPELFLPLLATYLSPHLSMPERIDAVAYDLEFTPSRLRQILPDFLPFRREATLYVSSDSRFSIELSLNTQNPQEGLWRLTLLDQHRSQAYFLCFSVLRGPRFFIGAIQGGNTGNSAQRLGIIKAATKHFTGLRPPFVLLHVLRRLAATWNISFIAGAADAGQVSVLSHRRRRQPVHFSYDDFFLETGATLAPCGDWHVPMSAPERSLNDVPHRKRSLYRRRHLLLQSIDSQVVARLTPDVIEPYRGEVLRKLALPC